MRPADKSVGLKITFLIAQNNRKAVAQLGQNFY